MVTLPVAIYLTRFSESYNLLHAGFAIPVAALFGFAAIWFASRARRHDALRLVATAGGVARAGRVLGMIGLCLVASALVALAVYGLLEYVGSRD